jgi:hypothetical protein
MSTLSLESIGSSAAAVLRMLFSPIPTKDHRVSINGFRKGPVTKADAGLVGPAIHLAYEFEDNGKAKTVEAMIPLIGAGQPGGEDEILWNGKAVDMDDVVISARLTMFGPAAVVEFKFAIDGLPMRVRVDAVRRWF